MLNLIGLNRGWKRKIIQMMIFLIITVKHMLRKKEREKKWVVVLSETVLTI